MAAAIYGSGPEIKQECGSPSSRLCQLLALSGKKFQQMWFLTYSQQWHLALNGKKFQQMWFLAYSLQWHLALNGKNFQQMWSTTRSQQRHLALNKKKFQLRRHLMQMSGQRRTS